MHSEQEKLKYPAIVLIVLGITVYAALNLAAQEGTEWNEERIFAALAAAIPGDAIDVAYEGEWRGYARHLRLQFESSPTTMHDFAKTFCDDVLHQHYDPFNSIDVVDPIDSTEAIRVDYSTNLNQEPRTLIFYSYSPIVSADIFGNKCLTYDNNHRLTGTVWLRIDQSNATQYSILIEYYAHHYAVPISLNELDVRPVRDVPILARGLLYERSEERYLLHPGMLCLEIDPLAYANIGEDWQWLKGSSAYITIDANPLPEAYITSLGTLAPIYDPEGNPFNENEHYFNYCYYEEWKAGEHSIEISVTDLETNSFIYNWTFYTD